MVPVIMAKLAILAQAIVALVLAVILMTVQPDTIAIMASPIVRDQKIIVVMVLKERLVLRLTVLGM